METCMLIDADPIMTREAMIFLRLRYCYGHEKHTAAQQLRFRKRNHFFFFTNGNRTGHAAGGCRAEPGLKLRLHAKLL